MPTTDNLFLAALAVATATLCGFFGAVALYVIGTAAVVLATIAAMAWLNYRTGGFVGVALALIGLGW